MADGINRTGQLVNGWPQRHIQQVKRIHQVLFSFEFLANVLQRQLARGIFQQEQQIGHGFAAEIAERSALALELEQRIKVVDDPAKRNIGNHVQDVKNGYFLFCSSRQFCRQSDAKLAEDLSL